MVDATGPRYVPRPGEQAFAPPYRQDGCALYAFAIPAERPRLQRVVERYLLAPSGGRLRASVAAEYVLLYFCDFARSQSHDPGDAARGWLRERECGLWIPLRVEGAAAPAFYTHAMFVDSGPAMCSGREVLGFPKEIGLIAVERAPARASCLAVEVLTTGGGRSRAGRWRPLIELERVPAAAGSRGGLEPWAQLLGVPAAGSASLAARALAALRRAGSGRAEFYNLKQFRDCADPTRACYQAIVRASAVLRGGRRVAAAGEYAYRVHAHASHPLAEELGLPAEGRARGVFCDLDFDFEPGVVL